MATHCHSGRWLRSALLIALTGCIESTAPELVLDADMFVVHAAPDAPRLDIVVEDRSRSLLDYASVSDRIQVSPGRRNVRLVVAGTGTRLANIDLTFEPGARYTVLAAGRSRSIRTVVFTDDRAPADSGMARIRLVHGAQDAGPVDIYVTAPGAALAAVTPTAAAVAFGGGSDYMTVGADVYQVRVTVAGSQTVLVDLPVLELDSRQTRTLVLVDVPDGSAHELIVMGG